MTTTPPTPDAAGDPAPVEPHESRDSGDTGPRITGEEARDLGRIRRSSTDRKIAGVAAGIARHFDIDPLLVRVGFVLLVIFGGSGLLAYGACWLLIPEEGTDDAVIRVDHKTRTVVLAIVGGVSALALVGDSFGGWGFPWQLAVIGLIIVAVMAARGGTRPHPGPLATSGWVPPTAAGQSAEPGEGGVPPGSTYDGYRPTPAAPPYPRNPRRRGPLLFGFTLCLALVGVGVVGTLDLAGVDVTPSAYPATVLAACGLMLLVGAFYGRAGGLILIGLVAAVATAATTAGERVDAGEIDEQPATAAALADGYDLFAGQIKIDLTDIEDLENLDDRTLDLETVFGRIEVLVPEDGLDVTVDARVDGGEVVLFGDRTDGSDRGSHDGGVNVPELTIDAEVALGQIEIETVGSPR